MIRKDFSLIRFNPINLITSIIFCLILFSIIIVALTPPASVYEMSIYQAYHPLFWFFLIFAIILANFVLIYEAIITNSLSRWKYAIFAIIFSNFIILILPISRGYFFNNIGDELSHIGYCLDILKSGHFVEFNVYPISHIFVAILSQITGIESRFLLKLVPSFFYLIYILGIFLLMRELTKDLRLTLVVISFSSVLLFTYFNYLFLPTQFVLYLVPFILFLYVRRYNKPNNNNLIVLLVFLLYIPFAHPLGSIFIIMILFLYFMSIFLSEKFSLGNKEDQKNSKNFYGLLLFPIIILSIVFSRWYLNLNQFQNQVYRATQWFSEGVGSPPIEEISTIAMETKFSITQLIEQLLKNYGQDLIFTFLSIVAILLILNEVKKKKVEKNFVYELFFILLFIFFTIFYISTLLGDFIATGKSIRIFCWALFGSTCLNGIFYYEFISKQQKNIKHIFSIILLIFISLSVVIGIFNVYFSPFIKQSDIHGTEMGNSGMNWFFDNKMAYNTLYFDQMVMRYPDSKYGFSSEAPSSIGTFISLPQRFDNQNNVIFGKLVSFDTYLVISEKYLLTKKYLWPNTGAVTFNDLNQIDLDETVNNIFSNGDPNIYLISPI